MRSLVATVLQEYIYGIGKKSVFKNVVSGDPVFLSSAKIFCAPNADQVTIETTGCKAMVSIFNGKQCDSRVSLRYSILSRKVSTTKTFVKPERLPPTPSATNLHSRRAYLQVMQWMGNSDGMDPTKWGWTVQHEKCVPCMMDINPAPDKLLKMIQCNCSAKCNTLQCTCKRHGLQCTRACGHCQHGNCDNMIQEQDSDEENIDTLL